LCAFATNEDGADKLSSAPPFKIFGSATAANHISLSLPASDCLQATHYESRDCRQAPPKRKINVGVVGLYIASDEYRLFCVR